MRGAASPTSPCHTSTKISTPPTESGTMSAVSNCFEAGVKPFSPFLACCFPDNSIAVAMAKTRTKIANPITSINESDEYGMDVGWKPNHRYAAHTPARAYSPTRMPAQPDSDRNLDERSIMERISARSRAGSCDMSVFTL